MTLGNGHPAQPWDQDFEPNIFHRAKLAGGRKKLNKKKL
jgi:hypothetical protein